MAKKYIADTFEGAVTGTASGNVAKTGDTMTGNLAIENTSAAPKLTIGDVDLASNNQSGATLEMGNRASNGLTGSSTIDLISGSFSQGSIQFRHGSTSTLADPRTMISSAYNGSSSDYDLKFTHYNGSTIDNYTSMRADHTYFNQPIRIGANASANELDDYEEGTYNFQFRLFRDYNSDGETISQTGFAAWNNRCKYTKIGNQVTLFLDLEYQNGSSSRWNTANTYFVGITNLPFTPIDNGLSQRYAVGGTYALQSYYQSNKTGHTIFSREGAGGNYGKYIAFAGTLDTAYPGNGYEPIFSNEWPQYRNYSQYGNVKITGTVTYQTTS